MLPWSHFDDNADILANLTRTYWYLFMASEPHPIPSVHRTLFVHAVTSPSAKALPNSFAIPNLSTRITSSALVPLEKPRRQSQPRLLSST